uniref:Uncharacterized protein n=1 Tax=Candidatus Kentrum sp. SD TaxID=2126332 RepID=A0A450YQL3_9GAMM|nr:MAG: hypothetical protein BECKSD772F_GA0070984_103120 [Candidatus Kentron sp. SD]VFK43851.1 MAG: hypothetical protein BECKSD772E_GA0070983_103020 [Candidatus Kentron sp. SD]VFK78527.1 MAG: hypothetical protein BECKSD772D_GA0070982_10179 [Candidatus Kentron sp. SD]
MSGSEAVTALLKLLEIFTSWPPLLVFLLLLFRENVKSTLTVLAKRLEKISVGDYTFEFSEVRALAAQYDNAELFKQILLRRASVSGNGEEIDYIDEDVPVAETPIPDEEVDGDLESENEDRSDFNSELNRLQSH